MQRPAGEEGRFEQYQAVTKVREQFLMARDLGRAYIASPTPATEQAARNQLAAATASLTGLNTFFSASAADTLRALSDAMAEYTQALLLARVNGLSTQELKQVDLPDWFDQLGLSRQLSPMPRKYDLQARNKKEIGRAHV